MSDRELSAHLLRRFGLGASEAELDYYSEGGYENAVDRLLNYDGTDEGFAAPLPSIERNGRSVIPMPGLVAWWTLRLLATHRPLQERMTLFWHNHFATSADKVKVPLMMWRQNDVLREHATGNFRTLLTQASEDPAMLVWLDNQYNVKGKANENFAREVMELFTLGIGHYSEQDIRESARAFTGWSLRRQGDDLPPEFFIRPRLHDDGEKTFMGKTGDFGGEDVLNMLCDKPQCSDFITAKILRFFVQPDPAPDMVSHYAKLFRDGDLEIKPLLRSIMLGDEFTSSAARRVIYKNPVDFVVVTARQLGLGAFIGQMSATLGTAAVPGLRPFITALKNMGMEPFYPPDVAGWKQGDAWVSSATMLQRISWAGKLFGGDQTTAPIVPLDSTPLFESNTTAAGVTEKLCQVFDAPIDRGRQAQIAQSATAIAESDVDPSKANRAAAAVCKLIFATPEFQFC